MSLDPAQIAKTRRSMDFAQMVGAWAGRHVEEKMALEFNRMTVKATHKMWTEAERKGQQNEFINLADSSQTNEIQRDAWNMIPRETKKEIESLFGKKTFMVRKAELDNLVGYREWSITEAWGEQSPLSHYHRSRCARPFGVENLIDMIAMDRDRQP
jgi:hypothetical protein